MGPEATLVFLEKFYALSRGRVEQERPSLLVDIDPGVPDRNEAWREHRGTPSAHLFRMGRRLRRCGADFCIMPCVTAHAFAREFEREAELPLLDLPLVVAESLAETGARTPIGLLATTTTLEMGLFQDAFAKRSLGFIVPEPADQERLMRAIYAVKQGCEATAAVQGVASALERRGARSLLLGCTDLSVLRLPASAGCPVVDALDILAERTLAEIESRRA